MSRSVWDMAAERHPRADKPTLSTDDQTASVVDRTLSTDDQTASIVNRTTLTNDQTASMEDRTASINGQTTSIVDRTTLTDGQTGSIEDRTASTDYQTANIEDRTTSRNDRTACTDHRTPHRDYPTYHIDEYRPYVDTHQSSQSERTITRTSRVCDYTTGADNGTPGKYNIPSFKDNRTSDKDSGTSGKDQRTSGEGHLTFREDYRTSGGDNQACDKNSRKSCKHDRTFREDSSKSDKDNGTSGRDHRTSGKGNLTFREDYRTSGGDNQACDKNSLKSCKHDRTFREDSSTSDKDNGTSGRDHRTSGKGNLTFREDSSTSDKDNGTSGENNRLSSIEKLTSSEVRVRTSSKGEGGQTFGLDTRSSGLDTHTSGQNTHIPSRNTRTSGLDTPKSVADTRASLLDTSLSASGLATRTSRNSVLDTSNVRVNRSNIRSRHSNNRRGRKEALDNGSACIDDDTKDKSRPSGSTEGGDVTTCLFCRESERVRRGCRIEAGDQIELPKPQRFAKLFGLWLYSHHAIVTKRENHPDFPEDENMVKLTVVEAMPWDPQIRESILKMDLRKDYVIVHRYKQPKFNNEQCVQRAYDALQESRKLEMEAIDPKAKCNRTFCYSLICKNCEDFATWIKFGVHVSQQVRNVAVGTPILNRAFSFLVSWLEEIIQSINRNSRSVQVLCRLLSVLNSIVLIAVTLYNICKYRILYKDGFLCKCCFRKQIGKVLLMLFASIMDILPVVVGCLFAKIILRVIFHKICKLVFPSWGIPKSTVRDLSTVRAGDAITYKYCALPHEAIVTGTSSVGLRVAHYAWVTWFGREIIEEVIPLKTEVKVHDYTRVPTCTRDETVRRAKDRIGEKKFNTFTNRSSHFVASCKLK